MMLGTGGSDRIDTLVSAMIRHGVESIGMDPAVEPYFQELHTFMYDHLYLNSKAKSEESKVEGLLTSLFDYYVSHPDALPAEYALIREQDGVQRAVCDYIAGMTDTYALEMHRELFIPRGWAMMPQ